MAERFRLIIDIDPVLLSEVRAAARAGNVSVSELVGSTLEAAQPRFRGLIAMLGQSDKKRRELLYDFFASQSEQAPGDDADVVARPRREKVLKAAGGKSR